MQISTPTHKHTSTIHIFLIIIPNSSSRIVVLIIKSPLQETLFKFIADPQGSHLAQAQHPIVLNTSSLHVDHLIQQLSDLKQTL
jgi:hypothetical protein